MNKLLRITAGLFITLSLFLFPIAAHAVDVVDPSLCNGTSNPDFICKDKIADKSTTNPITGPQGILTKVVSILSLVVAVISTIVILIAGIRYMVSQGDAGKLSNARNTIIYAIIALVVAALAQALVAFVLKKI